MSATAIRGGPAFEAIMNVVIIYDDFACATKAKANLERAAQLAGETTHGNVELCRLDLLEQSSFAVKVLGESANAHLIVVALSQTESLPAWLLDWLESWATRRRVRDAALAVFGGGNNDMPSVPTVRELSRFAGRHGLSFIFDDGGPAKDESAFFARNLPRRAAGRTPTLRDRLDEPAPEPHPGWGINE
ncbi:MAG: hypothetical protein WBN22_10180 [Verrucomicrobiia bacterium]